MREDMASISAASAGVKNSNFAGSGDATAACACVAAETIDGQFAVSQAAENPAALRVRNVLRSKGAAGAQSCSDMLKTLCGASYGVNLKIRKRQNGLLNGSMGEFAAARRVVYDFLEITHICCVGERVALHGDFYRSDRDRKQMAARQDSRGHCRNGNKSQRTDISGPRGE